jgi:hypothetical protein
VTGMTTIINADQGRSLPSSGGGRAEELFVTRTRGDGYQASIRGHLLNLADPGCGHALAPTPNDLLVVSRASELAWFTRTFLRSRGLPDTVGVTASWQTLTDLSGVADISLTLVVAKQVEAVGDDLMAGVERSVDARSVRSSVLQISFE